MTYDSPAEQGSTTGRWLDAQALTVDQMVHHAANRGIVKTAAGEALQLVRWVHKGRRASTIRVQSFRGGAFTIKKVDLFYVWAETVEGMAA